MPGNKQISQLTPTTVITNDDLFAVEQDAEAKSIAGRYLVARLAAMLDGHGGIASWALYSTSATDPVVRTYRVTMTDGTYFDIAIPDGATGPRGADGTSVSIVSTAVEYAIGTSGVTAPATGWSSTVPAAEPGDYLWTRTVVTYSGGTSTTSYAVSYIGVDGVSNYVHIRYADQEPTSDSDVLVTPSAWMGVYTGPSAAAPTAYTAYTWDHIRGGDWYTWIRYSDELPDADADMYASPTSTTRYMGVYTGPSPTAPSAWTDYGWSQIRGDTGAPAQITSMATRYAYASSGTQQPATFYATVADAAAAYGNTQGAWLWTAVYTTWNGDTAMPAIYITSYQGVDGDSITGLGDTYTAAWTATETSAALTDLTETLSLPAGTYLLIGRSPTSSGPVSVELRGSVGSQYWMMDTSQSYTWIRTFTSTTQVRLATASSASATYTNTAGGGLQAIRIK